jgi:hypothetical protein
MKEEGEVVNPYFVPSRLVGEAKFCYISLFCNGHDSKGIKG